MPTRYRVILSGQILAGHTPEAVRAALIRSFRLSEAQLDTILSGRRVTIKRDTGADEAKTLAKRIGTLGMQADIEAFEVPTPAASATAAPKSPAAPASEDLFSLAPPAPPRQKAAPPASAPLAWTPMDRPIKASTPDAGAPEPSAPPLEDTVACPQCGELQPRRTLCRNCGLDMPRHQAAQAALSREARETPSTTTAAAGNTPNRKPVGDVEVLEEEIEGASLLGLGFSGRITRMGYLGGNLLYSGMASLLFAQSLSSGNKAFGTLALILLAFSSFRLAALRLHDTGRSGWMSLLLLVPIIGQIFPFALLLMSGEDYDNDHGDPPIVGGGRAALVGIALLAIGFTMVFKAIERDPVAAAKMIHEIGGGRRSRKPPVTLDASRPVQEEATPDTHFSTDNRVALYTSNGCDECESMRRWLSLRDVRFTEHAIDDNPAAAEALHEKTVRAGIRGSIQLPVVEVNGELLSNPTTGEIQLRLKKD